MAVCFVLCTVIIFMLFISDSNRPAQLPRSPQRGLNMDSTDVLAVTQAPKNKFPSAVDFLGAAEIHPARFIGPAGDYLGSVLPVAVFKRVHT